MKLKVSGMMCEHCVKSVKKAAMSVEGVTDCAVDLKSGEADVYGNADINEVIHAINDQGFTASAE